MVNLRIMVKFRIAVLLSMLVSASAAMGQSSSSSRPLRAPVTDAEAKQMADDVGKMDMPAPNRMNDALQEARQAHDFYHSSAQELSSAAQSPDAVKKKLSTDLQGLKASGQACDQMDVAAVKERLKEAGTLPGHTEVAASSSDGAFADFAAAKKKLLDLNDKQFCAAIASAANLDDLQKKFEQGVDKGLGLAAQMAKWDETIADAWNARVEKLSEKIKPALQVTDKLIWLLLFLGLFGCGYLFLVRFFSPQIQLELVTSGQIIQFPTVVTLMIVLVILGLSEHVSDNTLSALLGGIVGHILSQRTGRTPAGDAQKQTGPPQAPDQPPPQPPAQPVAQPPAQPAQSPVQPVAQPPAQPVTPPLAPPQAPAEQVATQPPAQPPATDTAAG